jgi:hypothetical protein
MLLSPRAVETLERNSPSGLFEATFEGSSFSTCVRYFFASAVSPDLIADIRFVNAASNELLLLEELFDDELKAESSEISELVLCILEIDINRSPFEQISPSIVSRDRVHAQSYQC